MSSVWIVNHYAGYPEVVPATRTFELSRVLTSRGWNVTVVACSFNHYTNTDDFATKSAVHEETRDGVRWIFIKSHAYEGNGFARLRNMITFSRRAMTWSRSQSRPDVIIGTCVHPFAVEAARRIAKKKATNFCYEITDLWPESLVDLGSLKRGSVMYRIMRMLERLAFRDAVGVIGLMYGVPSYASDVLGIAVGRFAYIPNGINATSNPLDVGREPRKGHVVYAGGFARAHGLETVIDAAICLERDYPGKFTFDLYGDGPERRRLEEKACGAGLGSVLFHGAVPKAEIRRYISLAESCLCTGESLPVHKYGMSFNKLFDYFDAFRPVVFAVDSGNDPVSQVGAGVSTRAGDASAIAGAIVHLSSISSDERRQMGIRGHDFLESEHDFGVLGARLDKFLQAVVVESRLGSASDTRKGS